MSHFVFADRQACKPRAANSQPVQLALALALGISGLLSTGSAFAMGAGAPPPPIPKLSPAMPTPVAPAPAVIPNPQLRVPVATPVIPSAPAKAPQTDGIAAPQKQETTHSNSGTSPTRMEDVNDAIPGIPAGLKTNGSSDQGASPGTPQAISDQAAAGNLSSFLHISNPGTTTPIQATVKPIGGTDIGLERDPGNSLVSVNTDDQGRFAFPKLLPGKYTLKLSGKDLAGALKSTGSSTGPQPQMLVGLLLPAVNTSSREAVYTVPADQEPPLEDVSLRVAFTVGKNGDVTSLDWGDGKGPVDLAKTTRLIPLPQGMQQGELRGALGVVDETKGFKIAEDDSPTPVDRMAQSGSSGTNTPQKSEMLPLAGVTQAQAISDQAAQGNTTSFLPTSTTGTTTPQKLEGDPIPGVDVNLGKDPGGALVVHSDDQGRFAFPKLTPGKYTLKLSGKDMADALAKYAGSSAGPQPQAVLMALLLPAVQKVISVDHVIPVNGLKVELKEVLVTSIFTVGEDGNVKSLDWGDGKGPVDLAKTGKLIPLPQGMQPGELHGALSVVNGDNAIIGNGGNGGLMWGNGGNGGDGVMASAPTPSSQPTPETQHKPILIQKELQQ